MPKWDDCLHFCMDPRPPRRTRSRSPLFSWLQLFLLSHYPTFIFLPSPRIFPVPSQPKLKELPLCSAVNGAVDQPILLDATPRARAVESSLYILYTPSLAPDLGLSVSTYIALLPASAVGLEIRLLALFHLGCLYLRITNRPVLAHDSPSVDFGDIPADWDCTSLSLFVAERIAVLTPADSPRSYWYVPVSSFELARPDCFPQTCHSALANLHCTREGLFKSTENSSHGSERYTAFITSSFEDQSISDIDMTPPPRASQSFERPRQYGPDPASAAAAYHIEENARLCSRQPRQDSTFTSRPAPSRRRPSGNNQAGHDGRNTSEAWFDEVNTAVREPQLTTDGKTQNFNPPMPADGHARSDELPFYPQGGSFSSSDVSSKTNVPRRQVVNRTVATMAGNAPPTEKTDSNDFRSIIDDLTVENQALRERLSRAEAALAPPEVQQDRLFEVKVHGLPAHQKRELLETLTIFARKHDVLKEAQSSQHPGAGSSTHYASVNRSAQPYGGMINSSSHELLDSMHTSTSTSGQASTPAFDQKNESSKKMRKEEQPLQETPAGPLYKGYDPSMTDREKKIMIVKRLEQLFNGKRVSRSKPAKPGPALDGETGVEQITQQIREAQILPSIEESSTDDVAVNVEAMVDGNGGSQHEADHEQSDVQRMPSPQRETRPLDLDPNRTQTAQENINYIRHLGMSPKLTAEENSDTDHILGWVPLNLLFNLAQLHIFYVTPDFVRSAITEISTRFELSKDRQMVRWQGGSVDTKSSDSEGDRVMREATTDSSDSGSKRRKMGGNSGTDTAGPGNNHGNSTTASSSNRHESARGRRRYDLDYKPLFSKNSKSSGRPYHHDDGASTYLPRSTVDGDAYGSAPGTMMTHETNYTHPRSDAGPIVFFSGAHFVTDLSGDPKDAIAQDPRFFQYGTKRVAITPLGAERPKRPRPKAIRSHSGSRIKVRPFKDYSKCAEKLQKDSRLKTPERICSDDANSNDISFDPKWTDDSKSASPQQRIVMEASGIGGTKPDDNFVVIDRKSTRLNSSHWE